MNIKKHLYIFIIFIASFQEGKALNYPSDTSNIKIGLALSGGGAKGLAHIGVLREIERLGLRIDYISGTSMGAIIGGLYACGYNSYEIEELMRNNNFLDMLSETPEYSKKSLYDKEDNDFFMSLKLSKKGIEIPKGITRGQKFLDFYSILTTDLHTTDDFSKMPIPFVCFATNLENGEAVILEEGFLPLAVKASASYPTLVMPSYLDGRILTDGGISNNYPVKILKDKNCDIVIGVNVQNSLKTKEELDNIPEIMDQIFGYRIDQTSKYQSQYADIEILPNIASYNILSFELIDEIIEEGTISAKKHTKDFLNLRSRQLIDPESLRKYHFHKDSLQVDSIVIEGNKNYSDNYIYDKLRLKHNSKTSIKDLKNGLSKTYATGNFKEIIYKYDFSSKKMNFKVDEKESEFLFNFSLIHYDNINGFSIPMNFNVRNFFLKNSSWSTTLLLSSSDNLKFKTEYFLDNGILPSYSISFGINRTIGTRVFFIKGEDLTNIKYSDYRFKYNYYYLKAQTISTFREYFKLYIGISLLKSGVSSSIDYMRKSAIFDDNLYSKVSAGLLLNTLDDKYYPMRGVYFKGNFKPIFVDWYNYSGSSINIRMKNFIPISKNTSFFIENFVGLNISNNSSLGEIWKFIIGGKNRIYNRNFTSFYGKKSFEIYTDLIIKLSSGFRFNLFKSHYITPTIDLGVYDPQFDKYISGIGIHYGYNQKYLGPIDLFIGVSHEELKSLNIGFNAGFIINI